MSIVVVGGHSRNVGKTSVVAGLIAASPQMQWTAFKITQYGHGICSAHGEACDCATADHTWAVSEERSRLGDSDSSHFLAAGALNSWWVRTQQGCLAEAMPILRGKFAAAHNVIIESNSILKFLKPDLYLTVLDPATADFKTSAQQFLDRADAVLLHSTSPQSMPAWERVSLKPVADRPTFYIHPPQYVTHEVINFVLSNMRA